MAQITITEALAGLRTTDKKIEKKQEFILTHLVRQAKLKDPLVQQGGSLQAIAQEMQAFRDLQEYKVKIRRRINEANLANTITTHGQTRAIADWLIWRRDVAPMLQEFHGKLANNIDSARRQAAVRGVNVIGGNVAAVAAAAQPEDVEVHLDEKQLAETREKLESLLGELDGLLSLRNATITIESD